MRPEIDGCIKVVAILPQDDAVPLVGLIMK